MLRGLSAGITLYAPSIVLATILGWNIFLTTTLIGLFVVIYTVSGGTKAVSLTQRQQMTVIMSGMLLAGCVAYYMLPDHLSFGDTINLAGELGKFNMVNVLLADIDSKLPEGVASVDQLSLLQKVNLVLNDRYNIWTGLIASAFLFLSYFGTDQSQVARYASVPHGQRTQFAGSTGARRATSTPSMSPVHRAKMRSNAEQYPVDRSRGWSCKYDELQPLRG